MSEFTDPGTPVDLTNCDREPIHLLGRVQAYGCLMAVSKDWIVRHASANLEGLLGVTADAAIGMHLQDLIVSDGFAQIRSSLRRLSDAQDQLRLFGVVLTPRGQSFDVSVHQSGATLIVEIEKKGGDGRTDITAEVYPHIRRIGTAATLGELAARAAQSLQALSGFDSVMVYQFQPDASGKVIAEQRRDGRSKYQGLMFPASDIPAQARALYKRSLLRLIADVADPGAEIVPPASATGDPIDLSLAVTRSVSPIHIEYLKNMGVAASMSVSIMKGNDLWGLFACHHHSAHYIDYERRTAIEMFAHMFSYELSRLEQSLRSQCEQDMTDLQTRLVSAMADGHALDQSILDLSQDIQKVLPHDGLVIYSDETFHATGLTPSEDEFRAIRRFLDLNIGTDAFSTDNLSRFLPEAAEYETRCSGVLALPISRRPRDYVVLCRKGVASTVAWAGDPEKPVTVGPNGTRLTPRNSFETWKETVRGRAITWSDQEKQAADLLRTVMLEVFLKMTDAANAERKRAHEQQQLLISELNHRVRNILNLMQGLVSQTKGNARSLGEFTSNLDGRLHALARAHDQLTQENYAPASLKGLLEIELQAYAQNKAQRMIITGPDVLVQPRAYTTLALVLHEMATNSIKYGALCDQVGRIEITLDKDDSGALLLHWVERNGPPVAPPSRQGFGSTIISSSIPFELQGDAEINYKITGVEARFRIPPAHVDFSAAPNEDGTGAMASPDNAAPARLTGRCLVLEDSMLIALDAAAILEALGASEVRISSTVRDALSEIETTEFEFALLDVNLGNEQSLPVAQELTRRGIPFVLATGYGQSDDLASVYPPCEIVQKPFSDDSLAHALSRAIN